MDSSSTATGRTTKRKVGVDAELEKVMCAPLWTQATCINGTAVCLCAWLHDDAIYTAALAQEAPAKISTGAFLEYLRKCALVGWDLRIWDLAESGAVRNYPAFLKRLDSTGQFYEKCGETVKSELEKRGEKKPHATVAPAAASMAPVAQGDLEEKLVEFLMDIRETALHFEFKKFVEQACKAQRADVDVCSRIYELVKTVRAKVNAKDPGASIFLGNRCICTSLASLDELRLYALCRKGSPSLPSREKQLIDECRDDHDSFCILINTQGKEVAFYVLELPEEMLSDEQLLKVPAIRALAPETSHTPLSNLFEYCMMLDGVSNTTLNTDEKCTSKTTSAGSAAAVHVQASTATAAAMSATAASSGPASMTDDPSAAAKKKNGH